MGWFEEWVAEVRPQLARAFSAAYGLERGQEALAEAMAWACEHVEVLAAMQNPAGYLYRVGQSRTRSRPQPRFAFPPPAAVGVPEVEPALPAAFAALPERQRICVALIVAGDWTFQEVADLLEIGRSTVQVHVERGLASLRAALGVTEDV